MLAQTLVTAWQRVLAPRGAMSPPVDGQAAIHRYDPIEDFSDWARCRDRAQFHLGRARRAKDRGRFQDATREIERALQLDDTSESYFQVLGQCYLRGEPRNLSAARWALERAFIKNPRNGYTIQLLLELYEKDENPSAARNVLERAIGAGAPEPPWRQLLETLRQTEAVAVPA
jgi:tetratricopeptide (TPR) repeat protein